MISVGFFFFPTFALLRLVWNFPGGPVVKNGLTLQGYGGSISGLGTKSPHAAQPGLIIMIRQNSFRHPTYFN